MKKYSLFEITLSDFLYFSINGYNIMHIEEFPTSLYTSCGYNCIHHGNNETDRIIDYILMELF